MDGTGLVDMRTVAGPERPASFEGLYQAQYGRMLRLAYVLTDDHAVAEELVQDAFVGVYRKWADVGEPVAYLRRAVVNACRSHHRRRFLERRHPPQPERPVPRTSPTASGPSCAGCRRAAGPRCCCASTRTCRSRRSPRRWGAGSRPRSR